MSSSPYPRASSGARLVALALAGALFAAACSEAPAPVPPPATGATASAAAAGASALPERATPPVEGAVLEGRPIAFPAWGQALSARRDPLVDGWPSEAWALRVEARLGAFLGALAEAPERPLEALALVASPDAVDLAPLGPRATERVFSDGALEVWRPAELAPERVAPAAALAGLAELFAGATERRVERWVMKSEPDGERLDCEVIVRLLARHAETGLRQVDARWRTRWRTPDGGEPELVSARVLEHEEVRAPAYTYAEHTRAALAHNEGWERHLLRGNDAYHLRWDRNAGTAFLGMHGFAVGDVNGDGLEDVYLLQPGTQPNALLVQEPDGRFTDRAAAAGVDFLDNARSALIVDLDGDGDRELVVGVRQHLLVGWNDGTGRFGEMQPLHGPGDTEVHCLCAADADGDGDLDLYAGRYDKDGVVGGVPTPYHDAQNGAPNFFWRNDGGRKFTLATDAAGFAAHNRRFTLAALWEDFDEDGDTDLYVVNDFGRNNLYRNDGRGRFVDVATEAGASDMAAGMGATTADVDLDGDLDVYVSNMFSAAGSRVAAQARYMADRGDDLRGHYLRHARGNTLLLSGGDGTFADATELAGLAPGGWAWGGMFTDVNNDGLEDLYVPNGFLTNWKTEDLDSFFWRVVVGSSPAAPPATEEYTNAWAGIRHLTVNQGWSWNGRERNYAYLNVGGGRFADLSGVSGADYPDDGRAAAVLDWDGDGRLDLFVRNRNGPRLRLLRNVHPAPGRWVQLDLAGARSNTDAIGARAQVELADGHVLRKSVHAGEGHLVQSSRILHFGLGREGEIARVTVHWPYGEAQVFDGVEAGARWRLVEGAAEPVRRAARERARLAWLEAPGERITVEQEIVGRIVPSARVPLAPLGLPVRGGPPKRVSDFAGRPVLVLYWDPADATCRATLEALAARAEDVERLNLALVLLAVGEGGEAAERAVLDGLALAPQTGRAGRSALAALQVVLVEILGPYDDLPLPVGLLLDTGGQLVVAYTAPIDALELLKDASRVRYLDPTDASTERLSGGQWVASGGRDLAQMAGVFRRLGQTEMATFYEAILRGEGR